ncbi:hypothetical protein SJA_C2-00200 [Sphingobium indicum UT26S]|uniref:Uncharacterized protein n=1 Tax=Sphingobium indicum (strain DSM 16413 / CCM 7287 / MTCC 6362 / UT26 / NBRC 101211 / UT26S) TaxID=452662 RepID=D4Z7B4_SPHIU|nr:hypothetical protein SJA_C2-00200 [Sphingobium indicum UT26S]
MSGAQSGCPGHPGGNADPLWVGRGGWPVNPAGAALPRRKPNRR